MVISAGTESCCSGGVCSSSRSQRENMTTKEEEPSPSATVESKTESHSHSHSHSHKNEKKCCGSGKCSKSEAALEKHGHHGHDETSCCASKDETKTSSCCASKSCPTPAADHPDHHGHQESKSSCCASSNSCSKATEDDAAAHDDTQEEKKCCVDENTKTCSSKRQDGCCASKTAHHHSHGHSHGHKESGHHGHLHHSHSHGHEKGSTEVSTSSHGNSNSHSHSHAHDDPCCEKPKPQSHGRPDCVAILREDGDVDVYDVLGQVKTFRVDASKTKEGGMISHGNNTNRLCFSTHGHEDIDGYLTLCFDEDGVHGDPEDDCFCGIDGPHLHAHVHSKRNCAGDLKSKFQLATVTLLPKEDAEPPSSATNHHNHGTLRHAESMPVSASLPNKCNSVEYSKSLSEHGIDRSKYDASKQRFLQVQHENHVDTLVHNEKTGQITLEHDCDDCGNTDLHGTLDFVSKRTFNTAMDSDRKIQMNFYEIPKTPLQLLDVLGELFAMETDKAHVLRSAFNTPKPTPPIQSCCAKGNCDALLMPASEASRVVTSTLHVTGICCPAETPMINSILNPLNGVTEVKVVTTTKLVHVSHDPDAISASKVADALNKEKFGATIRKDGGALQNETNATFGRSTFFVSGICCAAEIPAIDSILLPLNGVKKVNINVPNKMCYVEHEFGLISARAMKEALDKAGFTSKIEKDAGAEVSLKRQTIMSKYVESTFVVTSFLEQKDAERVKVLLHKQYSKDYLSHCELHVLSKTIKVDHNPQLVSAEALTKYLWDAGIEVSVISDGFAEGIWTSGDDDYVEEEHAKLHWHIILSGIFWIVSMLHFIGGNWDYLKYTGILSVVLGMPKIASKACMTMKRKQFDTNCMMLFAAIGALALQEYSEAAAVTFLFSISDWLETLSTARARNALSTIVKLRPERAKVKDSISGKFVFAPASSVAVGSIVSVRTGDKIPCDGIVVEGSSVVDESSLTGESRPVQKVAGSSVSGGTINAGMAQLLIQTTSTADNSAVARLIRLVEDAQANRSPTEKLIDEFAKRYTPLVVILAISMCTFPWIAGDEVGREWTKIGLVTIVIACPCALIISTPVTYVAGLAAAAQRGIVVKGGAHLESLGRVKHIAFDKTGTLTEGNFKLLFLRSWGDKPRTEALQYLHCIEGEASHPLAAAIVAAAKSESVYVPDDWTMTDHQNLEGEGVMATINGHTVHVGNFRLFERLSLTSSIPEEELQYAKGWLKDGATVGFLSISGHGIVASYCVADAVRKEAKNVIASFSKLNIDVNMLTGDNAKAAMSIGRELGLSERQVKSQLLPHEKLDLVNALMKEKEETMPRGWASAWCFLKRPGLVLMCGDGVNDAPALATADVGVAMGAGAALAMETADVTLLDSNLVKLLKVVKLGKLVTRTIIENVVFSFVAKAVVMGFAFAGYSSLWAAIGSDVGAMLIVTANGMKLLPSKKSVRDGEGFDSFTVRGSQHQQSYGKPIPSTEVPTKKSSENESTANIELFSDYDIQDYEC